MLPRKPRHVPSSEQSACSVRKQVDAALRMTHAAAARAGRVTDCRSEFDGDESWLDQRMR